MAFYIGSQRVSPIVRSGEQTTRNIGEIIPSILPLTDTKLHLLDGSQLSTSSYANLTTYIVTLYESGSYGDLFSTEVDWQSAVTTYGVCGKFVYDSANSTIRLPKITGIIEGTTSTSSLGDLVQAGVPDITGTLGYGGAYGMVVNADGITSGAFSKGTSRSYVLTGLSGSGNDVDFKASDSNSIYGNSSTVQPQTIKVLYYMVID